MTQNADQDSEHSSTSDDSNPYTPSSKRAAGASDEGSRGGVWKKLLALAVVAALGVMLWMNFGDKLSLDYLAERETELRDYQKQDPVLVYGVAFAIYVTVTGLSLPGAAAMTLIVGWYFGLLRGLILVSFASTAGATLAFLLARFVLQDIIQSKFGDRLQSFNEALAREGAFYLFTLRLIPAVPFFVINVVMGLTKLKTWTYWWVSQIGMLPGTIVFVYAGSTVPDLQTLAEKGTSGILTPKLFAAFVVLGLFPIAVRKVMAKIRGDVPQAESSAATNASPEN